MHLAALGCAARATRHGAHAAILWVAGPGAAGERATVLRAIAIAVRLVDRINAWALNRLPSRRLAPRLESIDAAGLRVVGPVSTSRQANFHVRWASIDRVVGTTTTSLAGNGILLLFSLEGGGVLTITEDAAAFRALTDALHLHLPGAKRFADWSLELVGSSGRPVEIFNQQAIEWAARTTQLLAEGG